MVRGLLLLILLVPGQGPPPASNPVDPRVQFDAALAARAAGKRAEAEALLQDLITRSPGFAPAWQALGYERIGDMWVRVGGAAATPATPAAASATPANPTVGPARATTRPASPASAPAKSRQAVWSALQIGYTQQINAIRRTDLQAGGAIFEQGRGKLGMIRDPLAIDPLARELGSDASVRVRLALVDLLGRFGGAGRDRAVLNLVALVAVDDAEAVRHAAVAVLATRTDPRIEQALRLGLACGDEGVLSNCAEALGKLKARSAVGDLVGVLRDRPRPATLSVVGWGRQVERLFAAAAADDGLPPMEIALPWPLPYNPGRRPPPTPAFRNVVLDALIAISGTNNGFDQDAWLQWDREAP